MSFQTVQCPQCGKAHIEYPDPKLQVTCIDCKHLFKPFFNLKTTAPTNTPRPVIKTNFTSAKTEPIPKARPTEPACRTPPPPPQVKQLSRSEKIFEQIVTINKTVQKYKNEDLSWTRAGEVVLQEIKAQVSVLGKLVFESMDISIAQLKSDLKPAFTFTPLSNSPQSLGLILAYLYVKITEFGQEACILIIAESEHWLYSLEAIEHYKPDLKRLNVNF
jgi:phage FluMu protein Com